MLFFNVRVVFSSILQGVRALPIFPHQPSPTQLLQVETTGRFIAALACINAVSSLPLWSAAMTHEGSAVWKYAAGQLKSRSVETISGIYFRSFVYFALQLSGRHTGSSERRG